MDSYWLILPIRGLRLTDTGVPATGFFCPKWCVVGQSQFDLLANACRDNSSLSGNLEMLRRRLNPDSLLLVEYSGELDTWRVFDAYDDAETLIGAFNILSLLERRLGDRWLGEEPAPIFRARYIENCDLPIVIDRERLRMVGHTTGISWANLSPIGGNPRHSDTFLALAENATPMLRRAVLRERQPNTLQEELQLSMRALTAAFQATSVGQFIAGAVSSSESLLGDTWAQREQRLRALLPSEYHARMKEILDARHEFVHAARQPSRDQGFLGQCALAMVVQVWTVIARMPQSYQTKDDLWYRLRAFDSGDSFALKHPGPDRELTWVHKYLVSSHPNEYQTRFVVRGIVNCPNVGCGKEIRGHRVTAKAGDMQTFRCDSCSREFEATVHS
jgi:hypothetical protein